MIGYKKWVHYSPTFASGGSAKVLLQDIPDGRVIGFLIRVKLQILQGAAAAIITGPQLYRILDLVRIQDRVRATGRGLWFLRWAMAGATPQMPADVPAAAGTYSRILDFWIPFADFGAQSPLDTAINSQLLAHGSIELNWGNVAALYGDTSITYSDVRCIAMLDKPKPDEIASEPEIDFTDWNQQTVNIPGAGAISHLLVYKEDDDALLDTNYTTFTIFVDGETIAPVLRTGEMIAEFNLLKAAGVSPILQGAALPIGGEQIVDNPAVAAAAPLTLTVPWIPLIIPPGDCSGYQLTHLPTARGMLRVDFTGAVTAIRMIQRRIRFGDRARVVEIARTIGIDDPGARRVGVKVSGFGRLSGQGAQILPKTIDMKPEEIRRRGGHA